MTRSDDHDTAQRTCFAFTAIERYRRDAWAAEHGDDYAEVLAARSAGSFMQWALLVPDGGALDFLRAEAKRPLIRRDRATEAA